MLLDPLVLNYGQVYSVTGGVASNFRRTNIGRYYATDGAFTTDQPARLTIKPNMRTAGISTYSVKMEVDKNLAPVNGVQQADDTGFVEIKFGGNLRSFSTVDLVNLVHMASHIACANMSRIISNES